MQGLHAELEERKDQATKGGVCAVGTFLPAKTQILLSPYFLHTRYVPGTAALNLWATTSLGVAEYILHIRYFILQFITVAEL